MREVAVTINGEARTASVESRTLLSDMLRQNMGLTGTHVGCEHGYCGSCTVLVDGNSARSCLMLAVQVEGRSVETVESLAGATSTTSAGATNAGTATTPAANTASTQPALHPIQQAFKDCHGLQCGFCTPGLLMSVLELTRLAGHTSGTNALDTPAGTNGTYTREEIRHHLAGNVCRCTGYHQIVDAVEKILANAEAVLSPEALSATETKTTAAQTGTQTTTAQTAGAQTKTAQSKTAQAATTQIKEARSKEAQPSAKRASDGS